MRKRYRMYRRNGVFYVQDNLSGRQESLHIRSRADAEKLFHAKNEAAQGPMLNRDLGRVYLSASDPDSTRRTWTAVNIDWSHRILWFHRAKLKPDAEPARITIGPRLGALLRQLPKQGPFFPYWSQTTANDRAAEFRRRCRILKIEGVSLHSYRYAWAERAFEHGYPERYAQAALGHSSKAVHQAYAKGAKVVCPSLEEYENKVIPLPSASPKPEPEKPSQKTATTSA